MLIRPVSDLHLEFSQGNMYLPELSTDKNTVLILAGDIGLVKKKYTFIDFIDNMSARFQDVIYILGNHEHYGGSFPTTYSRLHADLLPFANVHLLEKNHIVIDGVAFICATLWTDMNNHDVLCKMEAKMAMNDYHSIRMGTVSEPWKRKLVPDDTIVDYINAKHYIFKEIPKHDKAVVITHHLPCGKSVAEEFIGDSLNGAYFSELSEQILEYKPLVWVHGHTHASFDYNIGDTRVVCNPRGYDTLSGNYLNPDFNSELTLEV